MTYIYDRKNKWKISKSNIFKDIKAYKKALCKIFLYTTFSLRNVHVFDYFPLWAIVAGLFIIFFFINFATLAILCWIV